MKQFLLWILLFHIGYFVLQLVVPTKDLTLLLWLAAASGTALLIPSLRDFITQRSAELAMINLLLVLLHVIVLITGVNQEILSFVALGLVGLMILLWKKFGTQINSNSMLDLSHTSVLVAIVFVLLCQTISSYCAGALATDFDSQNYLTWAFTAYKNYLPYRDVIYWYGLFSYYAGSLASLKVMTVVWSLLLFTAFAVAARRFIRDRALLSYFLLLCFTLIQSVGGFGAFFRYGTSLALSVGSSYLLSRKTISRLWLLLMGIGTASTMFLISDQGIYLSLIIAAQIFLRVVFIDKQSLKKTVVHLFEYYFWFGLGYGLVLVAAIGIMYRYDMLSGYLENLKALSMMGVFAKVALSRLLFSKENILTSITLFLGTQLFVYQTFFAKTKQHPFSYLLNSAWLMALWLYQNKFLVRPWFEVQIVLFSFMFCSIQAAQICHSLSQRWLTPKTKNLLLIAIITGLFSIIAPDKAVINLFRTAVQQYGTEYSLLLEKPGFSTSVTACLRDYFDDFEQHLPQKHAAVLNWINTQPSGETAAIFSFPGEPIFYLGRNQQPPAYFNAYDATSLAAQQKNIDYLRERAVRFVIWDTDNVMIQDGVPNLLRNNEVIRFILTHYVAKQQVGNYLVFEKTDQSDDFLQNPLIMHNASLHESLTRLDLKFYPVLLQQKMRTRTATTLEKVSQSGRLTIPAETRTADLFIKVSTQQNVPVDLELKTQSGVSTSLALSACTSRKPCLVPLKLLPIFFIRTEQTTVQISTTTDWTAELIRISD